jgi:hypothetical protein
MIFNFAFARNHSTQGLQIQMLNGFGLCGNIRMRAGSHSDKSERVGMEEMYLNSILILIITPTT